MVDKSFYLLLRQKMLIHYKQMSRPSCVHLLSRLRDVFTEVSDSDNRLDVLFNTTMRLQNVIREYERPLTAYAEKVIKPSVRTRMLRGLVHETAEAEGWNIVCIVPLSGDEFSKKYYYIAPTGVMFERAKDAQVAAASLRSGEQIPPEVLERAHVDSPRSGEQIPPEVLEQILEVPRSCFASAIKENDVDAVKVLLLGGMDPNREVEEQMYQGFTALILASAFGHEQCALALLKAGAAVDAVDNWQWTALMFAAENGHEQCALALIEAKANLEATQNEGWTAIMYAAQNGHEQCALALIKAKADLEKQTAKGFTALMLGCQNGHEKCALALIKAGAAVDARNNEGVTSLMKACQNGHEQCARALIKAGANLNLRNNSRDTAFSLAVKDEHHEIAKLLADAGAHFVLCVDDDAKPDECAKDRITLECLRPDDVFINGATSDATNLKHCYANDTITRIARDPFDRDAGVVQVNVQDLIQKLLETRDGEIFRRETTQRAHTSSRIASKKRKSRDS